MNRFELRDEGALSYGELAGRERFTLVWVPLEGEAQELAVGGREYIAGCWDAELVSRRVRAAGMERYRLVGKAAETAVYGLHVIGQGTLQVVARAHPVRPHPLKQGETSMSRPDVIKVALLVDDGRYYVTAEIGPDDYQLGSFPTPSEAGACMDRFVANHGYQWGRGTAQRLDEAQRLGSSVLVLEAVPRA